MPTTKIPNLVDARAMRAMGLPLTTEVEHKGELPERCDQMIVRIMKAAGACREAVYAYGKKQSERNYAKLKRAHKKLGREISKIPPPTWIDGPNGRRIANPEDAAVEAIVRPRCFTAYEMWGEIIAELDAGHPVKVTDPWPMEIKRRREASPK